MHYICYTCQVEFESKKLLVGRTEVVGACPCCHAFAPEGPPPRADTWQYSEARTREVARAHRYKGELVIWIQQGTNPGVVRNQRLVEQKDGKGISGIDNGICRTIVAAFCWKMLTEPTHLRALNDFAADMRCIPESYLELQQKYGKSVLDWNSHCDALIKLGKEQLKLLSARPSHSKRTEESERDYKEKAGALDAQLEVHKTAKAWMPDISQTGFGISLKEETTEHALEQANAESALKVVLGSYGIYHVDLSRGGGSRSGHAVGFWIAKAPAVRPSFLKKDIFIFIDPNTGVYVFELLEDFRWFMKEYWPVWLGAYPSGKIREYSLGADDKDEKRKRLIEKAFVDDEDADYHFV